MWQEYTPEPYLSAGDSQARAACESALGEMADIRQTANNIYRDVAHMAASALGYRKWGVPARANEFEIGDMGGWLLDLLQLWAQWDKRFDSSPLLAWMVSMVGKIGGQTDSQSVNYSSDPASAFGYSDLLADADAYLLAREIQADPSGRALSNAMRNLYQDSGDSRISRFYSDRFGASPDNVVLAFLQFTIEMEFGAAWPMTSLAVKRASGASNMPDTVQSEQCARAYADFLANPHR